MKSNTLRIAVCAAAFSIVAACNTPAEQAAENTADVIEESADAVRDNAEMTADNIEDRADGLDNQMDGMGANDSVNNRAADVRASGENKADAMENQAEMVREKAN